MTEAKMRAAFREGDSVVYTSNSGASNIAVILKVHFEDNPPFYTIHITETDIEKQTDEKNLVYLPLYDDDDDEDEDKNVPPPASSAATSDRPHGSHASSASSDKGTTMAKQPAFGLLSLGAMGGVVVLGLVILVTFSKHMAFRRRC